MTTPKAPPADDLAGSRSIEYRALDALLADERNPKAHDLDTLAQSVGRFGYVEPVVVDGRTGKLVSGHGRTETLRAMRDAGETAPEGVTVDPADGTWLVPVVAGWASRTDAEARAALIALNRTTELGGWVDGELLSILEELDGLADDDAALVGTGYGEGDLGALRERLAALEEAGGGGQAGPVPGSHGLLGEPGFTYKPQLAITVMCDDEEDQAALYEELSGRGLVCRVVSV